MNDYCLVVYYGKYGLRKEIFRGALSECREKRKKYCRKLGYVYDEKSKSYIFTDTPDGDWMISIHCCRYDVKIKKVKGDNSFYNTWDVSIEDNIDEKLWGHRYWEETIEMFKN
jgi:hypothetical protein